MTSRLCHVVTIVVLGMAATPTVAAIVQVNSRANLAGDDAPVPNRDLF